MHEAVTRAINIVRVDEWSGDMRANTIRVIGSGRVLAKAVEAAEAEIMKLRDLCGDAEHWLTVPATTGSDRDCVAVLCRKLCKAEKGEG